MKKLKAFIIKNRHMLLILYSPLYLYCFTWLEARDNVPFTDIHCVVDDWIPFIDFFIIPYLLWFLYVAAVLLYLALQYDHLEDYYRCAIGLILGMSLCLLVYYLFPNAQNMRPESFSRPNLFTDIISFIYASDTNTNVLPSIHVYNAVAIHVGLVTSRRMRRHKRVRWASLILCILICLSTMFLKQHSFLDVVTAIALYLVYYIAAYRLLPRSAAKKKQSRESS